jgi:hypothetical protein
VADLEREVGVWKAALKAADERETSLMQKMTRLERNIGALTASTKFYLYILHLNRLLRMIIRLLHVLLTATEIFSKKNFLDKAT